MCHYTRVVSNQEFEIILNNNIIPANRDDWDIYAPGAVVFLYISHRPQVIDVLNQIEELLENESSCDIVSFRSTTLQVEPDASNLAVNSVVHCGQINLNEINVSRLMFLRITRDQIRRETDTIPNT